MSAFNQSTHTVQCLESSNSVQMVNPYKFNGVNYSSFDFIGMGLGTYTFTGVTDSHPIGFVIDNSSLFEVISGTPFSSPKTIEGKSIQHYTGDIVVEVKGDFGQISYNCWRHGYMGGRISAGFGRLVYYEPCSVETPTLTQTKTITETETETITKTETETITETETQSTFVEPTETPVTLTPTLFSETFITNDSITNIQDFEKYLTLCGSSEESIVIQNYEITNQSPSGYNTFLVTYFCDLSNEINTDKCFVVWEADCDYSNSANQSFECLDINSSTIESNWFPSSDSNSIKYYLYSNPCSEGCDSTSFQQPVIDYSFCPNLTPTPDYVTPTETQTLYNYDVVSPVLFCGEEPHFGNEVCFFGFSENLNSPNSSADNSNRVFYLETDNGYFYEHQGSLISIDEPNHSKTINGNPIFFVSQHPEDLILSNKGFCETDMFSFSLYTNFLDSTPTETLNDYDHILYDVSSFVSIANTPTSTFSKFNEDLYNSSNAVKDESLFHEIIPASSLLEQDLLGSRVLSLNDYWYEYLPEEIYQDSSAIISLESQYLPTLKIIQSTSDLTKPLFSFSKNSLVTEITSKQWALNEMNEQDPGIYIYIYSLPVDFLTPRFYRSVTHDPVYDFNILTESYFMDITLEFDFPIDDSKSSSNFNSYIFPLERNEKLSFNLRPFLGSKNITNNISFLNNSGFDKTNGFSIHKIRSYNILSEGSNFSPPYNIETGRSIRIN